LFCVAKVPVLDCNIGSFAAQNRPFHNAKQWVLQGIDNEMVMQFGASCKIFTLL